MSAALLHNSVNAGPVPFVVFLFHEWALLFHALARIFDVAGGAVEFRRQMRSMCSQCSTNSWT
eukprot:8137730-Pyramimonas_sp.AAC.1